jgi:hypothetical protein
MNTRSLSHIPEDLLERYAMGRLSRQDCGPVHRHLPRCSSCPADQRYGWPGGSAETSKYRFGRRFLRLQQNASPSHVLAVILIRQVQKRSDEQSGLPTSQTVGDDY